MVVTVGGENNLASCLSLRVAIPVVVLGLLTSLRL